MLKTIFLSLFRNNKDKKTGNDNTDEIITKLATNKEIRKLFKLNKIEKPANLKKLGKIKKLAKDKNTKISKIKSI